MKWMVIAGIVLIAAIAIVVAIGYWLPVKHVATRSTRLRHTPEQVWAAIVPPQRTWKESNVAYEEVEALPPRRLVTRIADRNLPYGGTWTYQIAPEDDGCSLIITEDGEVYNPFFRFVSRFIMGHTATLDAYLKGVKAKLGES
jgi:hypothetical protein